MTDPTIRARLASTAEINEQEAVQLVNLINAAYGLHRDIFREDRLDDVSHLYEELSEHPENRVLLLYEGDELIATVMVRPEAEALYIGLFAVALSRQGQGLGSTVLRMVEQVARKQGLSRLRLHAVREIGNVTFYERRGFRVIAEKQRAAGDWGSVAPFISAEMIKELQ
uniref:N-acetyltransferase n=1 Tax=Thermosporothrix sp. COM3 TaxID=2490863 RepID=A0A455SFN5_9CHLR|nr:N-acetyltransferase [Thermosporothrix sp. COM3]